MSGGLRCAPAPPNVYYVPAERELVSVGPLPLYLSGGGQTPGHPMSLLKHFYSLNRRELDTTQTLDSAMQAAATIGFRRKPVKG